MRLRLLTQLKEALRLRPKPEGEGLVSGVPAGGGRGQKAPFSFKTCFERYENVGLVTAAVDSTVEMLTGPGFHTEGEQRAKELVDGFAEEVNLDGLLMDAALDMAITGNAWIEKVFEGEELVGLNYLDPLTMEQSIRLKPVPGAVNLYYPQIEAYQQMINSRPVAEWPPGRLIHLKWRRVRANPYGMGMVRPVEGYLQLIVDAEEDMGRILSRYAAPKVAWMLEGASAKIYNDVKRQLGEIEPDEDYLIATTGSTKIDAQVIQIDPRARFDYFYNHLLNAIMAGLETPITSLFRGDVRVSDASATAMLNAFDRKISALQRRLARQIEGELFKPLTEQGGFSEVPRLRFGPLSKPEIKMEDLTKLFELQAVTREEMRKMLSRMGFDLDQPGGGVG